MPLKPIDTLADEAKTWVFASPSSLDDSQREVIETELPRFLDEWTAHGSAVPAAWDLVDEHFLVIAADERQSPSGCSIDALFRFVKALSEQLGVDLLDSSHLFYRSQDRSIRAVARSDFRKLAVSGDVTPDTAVLDPTIDNLGAYRAGFERAASDSWHNQLLPPS